MARFWLAHFHLPRPDAALAGPAAPLAVHDARAWTLEVIEDAATREIIVLLGTLHGSGAAQRMVCRIGFANHAATANAWQERGFPLFDARIARQPSRGDITVCTPFFRAAAQALYDADLLAIHGLAPPAEGAAQATLVGADYHQEIGVPDTVFPATLLSRQAAHWPPRRSDVVAIDPASLALALHDPSPRYPCFAPFTAGRLAPVAAWSGTVDIGAWPALQARRTGTAPRVARFGLPAFRFEDVEVLGFRIDLDQHGAHDAGVRLERLVDRLNFHLTPHRGLDRATHRAGSDFRYAAASRVVMLELLRYGRMKLRRNQPPLTDADYQSQHEMSLRILVGRVDDDAAQARAPATYVPAIFVDNTWSKTIGRDAQGFDKHLAQFVAHTARGAPVVLHPDGRSSAGRADHLPLTSLREIRLPPHPGDAAPAPAHAPAADPPLLRLDFPRTWSGEHDAFDTVDLLAAYSPAPGFARWRHDDCDGPAFRRAFARAAARHTLTGLRSVQVSPVGHPALLDTFAHETAWITGTFRQHAGLRFARPAATARLTFAAPAGAPSAWADCCALLAHAADGGGGITLPPGSWYRVRCAMDYEIDDGFG